MDLALAISTISSIADLTKRVMAGKVDAEVKGMAADLNNSILSLQATLFSLQTKNQELLERNRLLEGELINAANWESEAGRYYLHELCTGVFVYSLKEDERDGEPAHYICPNCYQSGRKSLLQSDVPSIEGTSFKCKQSSCKAEYVDYKSNKLPIF